MFISGDEEKVDAVVEEISNRLSDACSFQKIKIATETTIVFVDHAVGDDEYATVVVHHSLI